MAWLTREEELRVVEAIRRAEARTSGEIRVHVQRGKAPDPLAAARARFARLGMARTAERNGVLLFVSLADRAFAVVGDEGIHQRVGEGFWAELRDRLAERFAAGEFCAGLEQALRDVGERLAEHFPRQDGDANELPDALSYDD